MIITRGVIEKINLDFNNHVNIAEYIKLADQSNNKLFKEINSKKKIYLVAKKTFIENRSELFENEKWKIKSFIIRLNEINIVTRNEMYNLSKKIVSICNFLLIPLDKKRGKNKKISNIQIHKLKKTLNKTIIILLMARIALFYGDSTGVKILRNYIFRKF